MSETDQDPSDEEIMHKAYEAGCVLITLDKDYGELAIGYGRPRRRIIRPVNIPGRQQAQYCATVLKGFESELALGAILMVTSDRVRIPPID